MRSRRPAGRPCSTRGRGGDAHPPGSGDHRGPAARAAAIVPSPARCRRARATASPPRDDRGNGGPGLGPHLPIEQGAAEFQDLVPHPVELFPEDGPATIDLTDPLVDALSAFPPFLLFFQGEEDERGIHRVLSTPDGPDYLIVLSPRHSSFIWAPGITYLNRSNRFIACVTKSFAIPSPASSPKTSSRSSTFQTLTRLATVRWVPASLTRSLPIRFSPSRLVERETR